MAQGFGQPPNRVAGGNRLPEKNTRLILGVDPLRRIVFVLEFEGTLTPPTGPGGAIGSATDL